MPPPPPNESVISTKPHDEIPPDNNDEASLPKDLSIGEVSDVWQQKALPALSAKARARFQAAKVTEVIKDRIRFELPNETHRERCEQLKVDIEKTLRELLNVSVRVELFATQESAPSNSDTAQSDTEDVAVDPSEFEVATDAGLSSVDRVLDAFPGAVASDDEGGR